MKTGAALAAPPDLASRWAQWQIWAVLALGASLRFYRLGARQLWLDELIEAIHSAPSSLRVLLQGVTEDRGATPLDYLIQHYVVAIFGRSEFWLRFHAALFGSLTIVVLFVLVSDLFDVRVGLMTSLLYALYPLHLQYSQEGRPYALFTLLAVCSFLLFWKVLVKRRTRDWLAYLAVTILLIYANYFGMFVIFSQSVFSCALFLPFFRRAWPQMQPLGWPFLLKLAATVALAGGALAPWVVFGIKTVSGYKTDPLEFTFRTFLNLIKDVGNGSYPFAGLLILLATLGAVKLKRERKYSHLLLLLCWLLLPLPFIFLLLWIKEYFFAIRQILFTTPPLFLLVSLGVFWLSQWAVRFRLRPARVMASTVALVALISLVIIGLHARDRYDDFRGAARFLQQNVTASDVVCAHDIIPYLAFYSPDLRRHSPPVGQLSALAAPAGGTIFVVKSKWMGASDQEFLDTALQSPALKIQSKTDFRGLEVLQFAAR